MPWWQSTSSYHVCPRLIPPSPDPTPLFRLKNLIPVNFTWQSQSSRTQSADSTPLNGGTPEQKDEERDAMCPSCKKGLSNSVRIYGKPPNYIDAYLSHRLYTLVLKLCSHVTCKTCTDTLVRPTNQCVVCDKQLAVGDILELKREGGSFFPVRCRPFLAMSRHWLRWWRDGRDKENGCRFSGVERVTI